MALYCYQKKPVKKRKNKELMKKGRKGLSLLFSIGGMVLVGNAVIPLMNYQFRYANRLGGRMISPLAEGRDPNMGSIAASAHEDNRDYTLISSWFDEPIELKNHSKSAVTDYRFSIPKLGIENAWVQIGGEDLKKKLIHYPDTALPGEVGNAVVFGHSVLPQFFNPKNYLTIFSTLHTLDVGDEIYIDFDGVVYRYLVSDMFEVQPDDISVLEQRYDGRYLTIITCTPPGTYLRRLIIKATLVN